MPKPEARMNPEVPNPKGTQFVRRAAWLLALWGATLSARAVPQFDVFLGYDGIVPEASWFPIVCEIKNDGPSFTGTVELEAANYEQGPTIRSVTELPIGTLKRMVLP